jgi:IS30 family transposase
VLDRVDAQNRLAMTYEQGKEMAAHARLADLTGTKVYFADSRSP